MTSREFDERELAWYELALGFFKRGESFNAVCGTICREDHTREFWNLWIEHNVDSAYLLPVLHTQRTTDLLDQYWFNDNDERVIALESSIEILKSVLND